ncbi:acyltransferase family protein [Granulicella sibirica]|uniref:Acyltransferase 3 n=1 Tax=Granulicella sibirica TaxID=2479048 RepID=A0A4Q0T044_9BACT|nr:acyltransferase [Granulicella sibirica]RXH56072.1 acyltransferase 3 [Granulicella sibirica]
MAASSRSDLSTARVAGSRHVPALDGIRGLAILMVLANHFVIIEIASRAPGFPWMQGLRDSLWTGVDVFFALSGFLITSILIETVETPGFFRNFYARRSLRIFPLYYAVVFLVLACTPLFQIHWGGQQWRLLTYTNRIFIDPHQAGWNFDFGGGVSLIHFWSLHVEEQFYLVWPLLVFLLRKPRRLLPLAIIFSLASLGLRFWLAGRGVDLIALYSSLPTRADGLFLGASLALLLQSRFAALAGRFALLVFLASSGVMTAIFLRRSGFVWWNAEPFLFAIQFTVVGIAATSLIALCLEPRSLASRVFRSPFLRLFGRYSYGLYIFQAVVPIFLREPMLRLVGSVLHRSLLTHFVVAILLLPIIVLCAVLSYRFFEKPLLGLKRHFEYRTRPTIPAAV